MNYQDPTLRSMLAGEYVLGTLRGAARRRFERLMLLDSALQREVADWEQKLVALSLDAPEVTPPVRVWRALAQKVAPRARSRWLDKLSLWRGLAVGASLLSVILAVLLLYPLSREVGPAYVAVFQNQQDQPLWLVRVDVARREGEVNVLAPPEIEAGKSLELWLLPAADRPPVSLGLMPTQGRRRFTFQQAPLWREARGLAISVEPRGGSPTGQPTGPVVYQTALLPI